jgi:hypothetical protein
MLSMNTTIRSNHDLFIPYDTGSPHDSLISYNAGLRPIARLKPAVSLSLLENLRTLTGNWRSKSKWEPARRPRPAIPPT